MPVDFNAQPLAGWVEQIERQSTDPLPPLGPPRLGRRFEEALAYAQQVHVLQVRKDTGGVPYVSHVLSVAALVLEDGGDEDEAIAGLLHDAAEDAGGERRLDDIKARFGERVAAIVRACTDTVEDPKPPWGQRKLEYLAHLATVADQGVLRVSLADKLHNARSILTDLHEIGGDVFQRFRAGGDQQLAYYSALEIIFAANAAEGRLSREFTRTVEKLSAEYQRLD